MTILDDHRQLTGRPMVATHLRSSDGRSVGRVRTRVPRASHQAVLRPGIVPLRHRGYGIAVSAAPHPVRARASVGTPVTVALAGLAALITVWLGLLGQAGADRVSSPAASPERLTVVQVRAGETLQHLAGRVAPETPTRQVAERIRDLNELGSAAIEAGQTLIVPVG